eukprot:1080352-Prymnesium_polylepis.1
MARRGASCAHARVPARRLCGSLLLPFVATLGEVGWARLGLRGRDREQAAVGAVLRLDGGGEALGRRERDEAERLRLPRRERLRQIDVRDRPEARKVRVQRVGRDVRVEAGD